MRETDQDTKTSSSDVFSSWFDKDASRDDRTKQESGQQTNSQRDRTSYRQGICIPHNMDARFVWPK